jgi:hypothetical protein
MAPPYQSSAAPRPAMPAPSSWSPYAYMLPMHAPAYGLPPLPRYSQSGDRERRVCPSNSASHVRTCGLSYTRSGRKKRSRLSNTSPQRLVDARFIFVHQFTRENEVSYFLI